MPFLTQPSQFMLAWDRHQIYWLAYLVAWFMKIIFYVDYMPYTGFDLSTSLMFLFTCAMTGITSLDLLKHQCSNSLSFPTFRDDLINPAKMSIRMSIRTSVRMYIHSQTQCAATNQIVVFVRVDKTFTTI